MSKRIKVKLGDGRYCYRKACQRLTTPEDPGYRVCEACLLLFEDRGDGYWDCARAPRYVDEQGRLLPAHLQCPPAKQEAPAERIG